jgi:DNA-binding transcriptional ArsR family regulator
LNWVYEKRYFPGNSRPHEKGNYRANRTAGDDANAIAGHFDITRQAVSKHLRVLAESRLVTQEQSGREIFYRLETGRLKELDQWLEQFRRIWESRYNELDNVLSEMKRSNDEQSEI